MPLRCFIVVSLNLMEYKGYKGGNQIGQFPGNPVESPRDSFCAIPPFSETFIPVVGIGISYVLSKVEATDHFFS
jgi:hypothetical protein